MSFISILLLVTFLKGVIVNCHIHYDEVHQNSSYLDGISTLVSRCLLDSNFASSNKEECDKAEYFTRILSSHNFLLTRVASIATPAVASVNSKLSYKKIFTDYISANKPAKGSIKTPSDHSSKEMALNCGLHFFNSLAKCQEYQNAIETFIVPQVAANSYLFQFPSQDAVVQSNAYDYGSLWPAIQSIDPLDSPAVEACPQNLHMLVWGVSNPVRARIFHRTAAHYFNPSMGSNFTNHNNSTRIPLHTVSFTGSGFPKISQLLAEVDDTKEVLNSNKKIPKFSEIEFTDKAEYLFVPNDHLVSFYPSEISEKDLEKARAKVLLSAEERSTYLYKMCFLDASNLNKFKEALDTSSKISPSDLSLLMSLETGLIDLKMNRTATDTPLSQLMVRTTVRKESSAAPVSGTKKQRTRSSSSSSSFRDWQEENKWNLLITSLTLPRPHTPHILGSGRANVSLEWSSPYLPVAGDTTRFGFNVTVCRVYRVAQGLSSDGSGEHTQLGGHDGDSSSLFLPQAPEATTVGTEAAAVGTEETTVGTEAAAVGNAEDTEQCTVQSLVRGGPLLTESLDLLESLSTGREARMFSAVLSDLVPHTSYNVRVTIIYDSSEGTCSERSEVFETQPNTAPGPIPLPTTDTDTTHTSKAANKKKNKKKSKNVEALPAVTSEGTIGGIRAAEGETPNSVCVEFTHPFDDGGLPILGYHVWARLTDHTLYHRAWKGVGAYLSTVVVKKGYSRQIVVKNLLARTSYVFQLQAFNSIGSANMSYVSNHVTTASTVSPHTAYASGAGAVGRPFLYGRGHPLSVPSHPFYPTTPNAPHMLVTLDDTTQTLTLQVPQELPPVSRDTLDLGSAPTPGFQTPETAALQSLSIDGWISHFSPLLFSVMAECVWAIPAKVVGGEGGILNPLEFQSRIVVVMRGVVPIVSKALTVQHLGGVGMVVIDDNDCTGYDQSCLPGADRSRGEGFAKHDLPNPWNKVRIPVIFLLRKDAELFLNAAKLSNATYSSQPSQELGLLTASDSMLSDEL